MKRILLIGALIFAAAPARAGNGDGSKAPDFKIARVLNAPVTKINGLADLKGKVVFLDFWATWCAPCVQSLPEINRLRDKLKGEPIVFLTVTDEPESRIRSFLKTYEIRSWVGIDTERSAVDAFRVSGIPDGYLIGKDGTLLARGSPGTLREKDFRDAIEGRFAPRPIEWNKSKSTESSGETFGEAGAVFELRVSSGSGEPVMKGKGGSWKIRSFPFQFTIAYIWGTEERQVLVGTPPVSSVDITLTSPELDFDQKREVIKPAIQAAFRIKVAPELRETDVFVLALSTAAGAPRPEAGVPEGRPSFSSYGMGSLTGAGEMSGAARTLSHILDRPVVDETGLAGTYKLNLAWTPGNQAELDKRLAGQGLLLSPARRSVEFLRVTPAAPDIKAKR
jgi:uncharacterized protein (TIGR03435 family)